MRGPSTRSPDLLVTLNLFPRPLLEISSQELPTRLLHKTSMRNLGTKSPDISGPPGKTSVKDLLKGAPIWDISIQDPLISLDLLGLFTGALNKISSQDPYERSLYKSSLQDLFTRPLWEISLQELSTRSLHRTPIWDISIQDPRVSLDLLGLFTGALYKISSQRPLWEISLQELSTRSLHRTPIWDISMQDLRKSLDRLGLFTAAICKISSQDLYMRGP